MSEGFLGCLVSVDCVDLLGTYQGLVTQVNKELQTLTISKAFRNGKQCPTSANDIRGLDIIKNATEASSMVQLKNYQPGLNDGLSGNENGSQIALNGHKNMLAKAQNIQGNRLSPLNAEKRHAANGSSAPARNGHKPDKPCNARHHMRSPVKSFYSSTDVTTRRRSNSASEASVTTTSSFNKATTPRKGEGRGEGRHERKAKEDCFSASVDSFLGEFDFEKNLALFDKAAVFEEIESNGNPAYSPPDKKAPKYRCDENVLSSGPTEYEQIVVPSASGQKYVTDSGLVVPTIGLQLRNRLLDLAEKLGLSRARQIESVGRSAAEMVLHLVGGSHRLTPRNAHQKPTVVVLCGPHHQGAIGMNCARHLATHGCGVVAFVPSLRKMYDHLEEEVKLFQLTDGTKTAQVKELPKHPVDVIVNTIDTHENVVSTRQQWYIDIVKWANQHKAPVLAVDSPSGGSIRNKWLLEVVLPLTRPISEAPVYLSDVSLPESVFKRCGISYKSPFGHRFCIPLHSRR